jgi:hypothetical protein
MLTTIGLRAAVSCAPPAGYHGAMKWQCMLLNAFLAITFGAIALGAIVFVTHANREFTSDWLLAISLALSPIWLIPAFAAYAFGRRRFTVYQLILFIVAEAVAMGYLWLIEMRGV